LLIDNPWAFAPGRRKREMDFTRFIDTMDGKRPI